MNHPRKLHRFPAFCLRSCCLACSGVIRIGSKPKFISACEPSIWMGIGKWIKPTYVVGKALSLALSVCPKSREGNLPIFRNGARNQRVLSVTVFGPPHPPPQAKFIRGGCGGGWLPQVPTVGATGWSPPDWRRPAGRPGCGAHKMNLALRADAGESRAMPGLSRARLSNTDLIDGY